MIAGARKPDHLLLRYSSIDDRVAHGFSRGERESTDHSGPPPPERWATRPNRRITCFVWARPHRPANTGLSTIAELFVATALGCAAFLVAGCVIIPHPLPADQEYALRDRAVQAVKRAVRYEHAGSIRAQGIEVLQRHLPQQAPPWIRIALLDEDPGVRFAAILALGTLKDRASYGSIHGFVDDEHPSLRVAACYALHRMGDTGHTDRLPALLLDDPMPEARRDAAFVLGLLGEPGAVKLLAKAMRDDDESVRNQALESMALLGHPDAIQQLTFWAGSGQGVRRVTALNTLADLDMPSLEETFRYQLRQGEFLEMRLAAARGLGRRDDGNGFRLALWALNFNRPQNGLSHDPPGDQIMRVRQLAAKALGAIQDRRALPALRKQLNECSDPRVQLAAADAILEILGPPYTPDAPWVGPDVQTLTGGKP